MNEICETVLDDLDFQYGAMSVNNRVCYFMITIFHKGFLGALRREMLQMRGHQDVDEA
jgi:hypothetical protein